MARGIYPSDKFFINARWSIGTATKKIFVVFLIGKDRRIEEMSLIQDRRQNISLAKTIIYTGIFAWVLAGFLALSAVGLYLAKSYAGIDIVKNGSPFPSFLKDIGVCH